MKTKPSVNQIRRTLRSLASEGLIVCNRTKQECGDSSSYKLPYWELEWQLSGDMYRNALITECQAVYKKVDKAKHGCVFFGSHIRYGIARK
jgi:transcription initiation factor IIE alpha subunit